MRHLSWLVKYRLFILFILVVLFRLPSIERPVSKHHEFNTAVILINAESWQQAGGAKQFYFTPLLNYQGRSNRVFEKGFHIDNKGNHVYLSFGAGWYVLPWAVFNGLHLSFSAFNLRVLNIIIGIITLLLFYRLVLQSTASKNSAYAATVIFAFLPAPLWYMGIGYVTTAIMLPFVIGILMLWQHYSVSKNNIHFFSLFALFLAGNALCYFDWLSVFLLSVMALWAFGKSLKEGRYLWITIIALLSIITGVLLVLWQFAAYLGWEQVLHYWQARFAGRSVDTSAMSLTQMLGAVMLNLITGFAPLIFTVLAFFKYRRKFAGHQNTWPFWLFLVIFLYNGIFLNWSAVHEFAWMAFGLFACFTAAVFLFPIMPEKNLHRLMATTVMASLIMYFFINPPGSKSLNGDRYDKQQVAAEWISMHVKPSTPIFITGISDKVIEYYCKRTFTIVEGFSGATQTLHQFSLNEAVLLQVDQGRITKATWLKAK